VYKYEEDVDKWVDWAIVLAWVFLFRIMHYMLMCWTNRHFGKSQGSEKSGNAVKEPPANVNGGASAPRGDDVSSQGAGSVTAPVSKVVTTSV
jgi:hypothetical protein